MAPRIIHLSRYFGRRAIAARRMHARGYQRWEIGVLLGLSSRRLAQALAGDDLRVWSAREREVLAREFRRAA